MMQPGRGRAMIFVLPVLAFITAGAHADDWTRWRGPRANGVSNETHWNPQALKKSNVAWQAEVGFGHSAVAVQGNRLYTMGNKTIDGVENDIVSCLDTQTGKTVWEYAFRCPDGGEDPGPGSTPVLDGDRLYTLSREGHLFCLNAQDGSVIWKRHVVGEGLADKRSWGFSSSPVIFGEAVVFGINTAGLAFDKKTGATLWNSDKGECGFSTPVPFAWQGQTVALILAKRKLKAVDPATGKERFSQQVGWGDADPIPMGDKLFLEGQSARLMDFSTAEPKDIWDNKDLSFQFQSGVVVGDYFYGWGKIDWDARTEAFYCIDMRDGALKWSKNFEMWGACAAAGDKILVVTGNGHVHVLEASPQGWSPLASADVVPMADNSQIAHERRHCFCWTNPVLANGKLYIRNNHGTLVCVNMQ